MEGRRNFSRLSNSLISCKFAWKEGEGFLERLSSYGREEGGREGGRGMRQVCAFGKPFVCAWAISGCRIGERLGEVSFAGEEKKKRKGGEGRGAVK